MSYINLLVAKEAKETITKFLQTFYQESHVNRDVDTCIHSSQNIESTEYIWYQYSNKVFLLTFTLKKLQTQPTGLGTLRLPFPYSDISPEDRRGRQAWRWYIIMSIVMMEMMIVICSLRVTFLYPRHSAKNVTYITAFIFPQIQKIFHLLYQ